MITVSTLNGFMMVKKLWCKTNHK